MEGKRDFFISYNKADKDWAKWVARILETKGYSVYCQAWDIRPSDDFIKEMNEFFENSKSFIGIFSEDYFASAYCNAEWRVAFNKHLKNEAYKFLGIRIEDIEIPELLDTTVYIDLRDRDEKGKTKLLQAVDSNPIPRKSNGGGNLAKIITVDSAPHPSAHFIGRQDELDHIRKCIDEDIDVVLISGMGGIGKSEICKKLFHGYLKNGGKIKHIGWVVWDGSLKNTLSGKFHATAEIENAEESFEATKEHINSFGKSLLLFIDNLNEISQEDKAALDSLLCNVVITSRLGEISGSMQTVKIGELPEDECVSLYKETLDRRTYDDETVREIVKKAARLTLVVELLAKTARSAGWTDEKLLKQLIDKGFNLSEVKKKVDRDKRFNENLSELFNLSGIDDKELLTLKQFSLFAPMLVDFENAERWFEQDDPDILNDLANRGWLIKTEDGFYMHHVISDVVKYENKPVYEECADLIKMLGNDLRYENTEIFTSRLKFMPFGERLAEYFDGTETGTYAYLLGRIAWLYDEQADYEKALKWYSKALEIDKKVSGEEHQNTAATYNNMAGVYDNQGDYDKALEFYGKDLAISEKALGKEHPNTATTYNNIAGVYYQQGDYDKALEFCGKALAIFEKVFGKEHPDTAMIYNNIAEVYNKQGDDGKALEFHGKALKIREKILSKEHTDTAMTYHNMAVVYDNQGKYEEALAWFLKAYKIKHIILTDKHPDTIITYNYMKITYQKLNPNGNFENWLREQLNDPTDLNT